MLLHWQDIQTTHPKQPWPGMFLDVSGRPTPSLQVDVFPQRSIRVEFGGSPRLWARVVADYWGYEVLRSPEPYPVGAFPQMAFHEVVNTAPRSSSLPYWGRVFAEMLRSAPVPILHEGRWRLEPAKCARVATIDSQQLKLVVNQEASGWIEWDFGDYIYPLTLRDMSDHGSGRVKAWRKHARHGTLPPVLLFWVSGLGAHVVLDGHDRLLAAHLEGTPIEALQLHRHREEYETETVRQAVLAQVAQALDHAETERKRPTSERLARAARLMDAEGANDLLLRVFCPRAVTAPTLARGSDDALERWKDELSLALTQRAVADSTLLEPAEGY